MPYTITITDDSPQALSFIKFARTLDFTKVTKNKDTKKKSVTSEVLEEDEYGIQEDIREKNPDFVFVGITSPKKEYIIQKFMDQGVNSVFMGVGGSFDVLSGHIKRAPLWMQNAHLEWLFRVANEPRRLFKRYFVGNATFIKRVLDEKRKSKK